MPSVFINPYELKDLGDNIQCEFQHNIERYCHNCGSYKDIQEVWVFGLRFFLCGNCYEKFKRDNEGCLFSKR